MYLLFLLFYNISKKNNIWIILRDDMKNTYHSNMVNEYDKTIFWSPLKIEQIKAKKMFDDAVTNKSWFDNNSKNIRP
jgi:hypothetical protein